MAVRVAEARRRLLELATRLAEEGRFTLPSEPALSSLLGSSRSTVRSALLGLQKDGFVHRVHGRPTALNALALKLHASLNEDREYLEVLSACGYAASTEVIASEVSGVADKRELVVTRLFRGDGRPAIVSQDRVALSHLIAPVEEISFETSTFRFAARWCRQHLVFSVAEVIPASADERLAGWLDVAVGTPLLMLDQQHLNDRSQPVIHTRSYSHDAVLRFSVVRAGVGSDA